MHLGQNGVQFDYETKLCRIQYTMCYEWERVAYTSVEEGYEYFICDFCSIN